MADKVWERLTELLECAQEELTVPACLVVVRPGSPPPDLCSVTADGADGVLWVSHTNDTPGWPTSTGNPQACAVQWTATFQLGVVRCAASINDSGKAPTPEAVTADAEAQNRDRWQLLQAIVCCWGTEGKDYIVDRWDAIPPNGKCVGGVWTIRTVIGGCNCRPSVS